MEELLKAYYADNAKKLRGLVDKILSKFGGLSDKDRDDFYSLANEVFVDAMRRCEDIEAFDVFLYACLSNKIKTEMSKINCEKRKADRMSVSIDAPAGDDTGLTVGDLIADRFDMENAVFEKWDKDMGCGQCCICVSFQSFKGRFCSLRRTAMLPMKLRKR